MDIWIYVCTRRHLYMYTCVSLSLYVYQHTYSHKSGREYDLFMDMDGCGKSMADSTMIVDYPMNPEERFVCGEDQSEVSERASEVSERAEPHTNQPTRFLSLGAG